MPGLVRKLLIFAAVDGLILQPAPPRDRPPSTQQAIKIDYKGNVSPLLKDRRQEDTTSISLEAHGVVGLLQIARTSFLLSITGRELVAQIRGKPIYVITDVALIPLTSQGEAHDAIKQARDAAKRRRMLPDSDEGTESESETDTDTSSDHISVDESLPGTPPPEAEKDATTANAPDRKTSVAQDVIGRKGLYGRFAQRWFSKKGWSSEATRMQGMSSEEDVSRSKSKSPKPAVTPDESGTTSPPATHLSPPISESEAAAKLQQERGRDSKKPSQDVPGTTAFLPKILRTTKLYFSSRSFFFSYDYDLSRNLSRQTETSTSLPMSKLYDSMFFWNESLSRPLMEAGQHNFVLPLIQGFVGQRAFSVNYSSTSQGSVVGASSEPEEVIATQNEAIKEPPSPKPGSPARTKSTLASPQVTSLSVGKSTQKDFVITLISRRSVERAGLRYLRRGVDEDGHVANSVETEQILAPPSWDSTQAKIYSVVQYRGSIPLFFSQSPYSLKPLPELWGSHETNAASFKRHFAQLAGRYGDVQAASLVDKHGSEKVVGQAYEEHAKALNENGGIDGKGKQLGFEWFDFHHVCRGMKFENVALLISSLGKNLKSFGWTVEENGQIIGRQSGVLRTNCMDCLDRTNVVQSALGREALEKQLEDQHVSIDLQNDPRTSWFNTLWADNGDAISRQYAGTAALKGDYTRTRKRNIAGALTDFGLTLSRYYNNIVNDFFTQAVIDYLLGRATENIFIEFEDDMKAQDYAIDLRKVRQVAISRCSELVIEDAQEDLVHGWTLSCPARSNTLRALPFEECVLLLTERAVYFCRFDWGTEKVREFERIELKNVRALRKGTYITSTLAPRHANEDKNVGFTVEYVRPRTDRVRINTRSLANQKGESEAQVQEEKELQANNGGGGADVPQTEQQIQANEEDDPFSNDVETRFLAFKALPPKSSFATTSSSGSTDDGDDAEPPSERELVGLICDEIVRAAGRQRSPARRAAAAEGTGQAQENVGLRVDEGDVISLAEAKKSTGYLEQIGYSLKKLVWA
ncbi:SacI homology domain-containing protein [Phyllosticta citrichinensis]|uniref:SacI homology domain-containing protein n=1 Tax=Phyllosticta citrichinensis TaxID=1130410 RepID=A0ABR1Y8S5_9PEZI